MTAKVKRLIEDFRRYQMKPGLTSGAEMWRDREMGLCQEQISEALKEELGVNDDELETIVNMVTYKRLD